MKEKDRGIEEGVGNSPDPRAMSGKQQRRRGARRTATLAAALGRGGCELARGRKLAAKRDKEAERDRSAIYEA